MGERLLFEHQVQCLQTREGWDASPYYQSMVHCVLSDVPITLSMMPPSACVYG